MSTPKLDLIGIVVDDMAETLAFYRQLGIDIPEDADTNPHVEVVLANGMRVAWDTVETIKSFDPDYQKPTGSPRVALAFRLDTPEEVDSLYAQLTQAGHHGHKEPWDAFWGQRYALVHDPNGNSIDLFAPLPPQEEQ
jgi:uncharacterized glyoxalase superfamily protein PhnB